MVNCDEVEFINLELLIVNWFKFKYLFFKNKLGFLDFNI